MTNYAFYVHEDERSGVPRAAEKEVKRLDRVLVLLTYVRRVGVGQDAEGAGGVVSGVLFETS